MMATEFPVNLPRPWAFTAIGVEMDAAGMLLLLDRTKCLE